MPAFIFLGWAVGLILAVALVALPLLAACLLLVASYVAAYSIATASIGPLLPALTGQPQLRFPLTTPCGQPTPAGVAVIVPATGGELFARGLMFGLTAVVNALLLKPVPLVGPLLAAWSFTVISLGTVSGVARNRRYQGFLGWSSWLLPLSYLATGVGLLLFVLNVPFAFALRGRRAFALDWTTGVIETTGGLPARFYPGGFSLGNFTFIAPPPLPGAFTAPSLSSHETGHSLNTAAFGGVVLWLNAIDENLAPRRMNLAYGELLAEGHANALGPDRNDYSLRLWF
ncbi:MAG TPA: hypothetical protein VH814_12995 [Steroidobacteraceae bacterium]|jgi:hypothetical protein